MFAFFCSDENLEINVHAFLKSSDFENENSIYLKRYNECYFIDENQVKSSNLLVFLTNKQFKNLIY